MQLSPVNHWLTLKLFDRQVQLLRMMGPEPVKDNIVIVGIDDTTIAELIEPMALWHKHLGDFFTVMAAARPKAVGVDLELPNHSYDSVAPGYDRALLQGLLALKRKQVPVVIARGENEDGTLRTPYPPFIAIAGGESAFGVAAIQRDIDLVPRRFDEHISHDGTLVHTLAGQIVRRFGIEPNAGIINYTLGQTYTYIPFHEVIKWQQNENENEKLLEQTFAQKIVLLGTVFATIDRHHPPVKLARWDQRDNDPGVLLHAQILRSVLNDGLIKPVLALWQIPLFVASIALWWLGRRMLTGVAIIGIWFIFWISFSTLLLHNGWLLPITGSLIACLLIVGCRLGLALYLERCEAQKEKEDAATAHLAEITKTAWAYSRFVPKEFLQYLNKESIVDVNLGDQVRKEMTVLFSDIRSFTTISEGMTPEENFNFINDYLKHIGPIIRRYPGSCADTLAMSDPDAASFWIRKYPMAGDFFA